MPTYTCLQQFWQNATLECCGGAFGMVNNIYFDFLVLLPPSLVKLTA